MKPASPLRTYLQEIVFGIEDSLVSTVGAVTGMAVGAENRSIVILAGLVIIVVEATSMSAGSYLSNRAARDANQADGDRQMGARRYPVIAGVMMGVSYLLAGGIPLSAYLFLPVADAVGVSVALTLVALFFLGAWQTKFTKRSWVRSGGEMMIVGGTAIAIGYVIGRVASQMLGLQLY